MNRIGWFTRTLAATGLVIAAVLTTAATAQAEPVNDAAAQEVVFSVSDGSSYEQYLIRVCPDPDEPGCQIRRVPGSITFRVTIDISLCCKDITVRFNTVDGSAHAPSDYNAVSGTLTFPPGVFSKTVTVGITTGGGAEPTETFRLRLSSPNVPGDVSDVGVGTIRDGVEEL
jgi:hypothetical protein